MSDVKFKIWFALVFIFGVVALIWSCSNYYSCMEEEMKTGLTKGKAHQICRSYIMDED